MKSKRPNPYENAATRPSKENATVPEQAMVRPAYAPSPSSTDVVMNSFAYLMCMCAFVTKNIGAKGKGAQAPEAQDAMRGEIEKLVNASTSCDRA